MKITAIIPVYNALNDVKLCLESIIDKFNFELGEVIVINDYSNNKTTDYLRTITKKKASIAFNAAAYLFAVVETPVSILLYPI